MTVVELEKISCKVGIPIMTFFAVLGIAIWFIPPIHSTSNYPILDVIINSSATLLIVRIIASLASVFGILGTLAWTLPDKDKGVGKW